MLGLSIDKDMFHAAILLDRGDIVSNFQTLTPLTAILTAGWQ